MDANYNLLAVEFNPFEQERVIDKVVPLNESQKEIWISCILGGDDASLAYNESVSLNLKGEFNQVLFLSSVGEVIVRHDALRSTVSANGETLMVYKESLVEFIIEDISMRSSKKETLYTFVSNEMHKVFDLQNGPLLKVFIHKLSDSHYYFTVIMHHIIADGWSIGIFLEELSEIYNSKLKGTSSLLKSAFQISEYAKEMIDFKQTAEYEKTLAYWLNMYKAEVPVLNLPIDYSRPMNRTYQSNRFDQVISVELIARIKKTGASVGCSLVTTLLSAFEIFIYNQSNQKDIVIGLPASGQAVTEKLDLIGHCVNLLPLRTFINPEIPFSDYLQKRKVELLDAFDHQQFTFGELVRSLNIKRDLSRIPIVSVVFNVDMGMDSAVRFDRLEHHLISNPRVCETFEIFLNITGSSSKFTLEWSYNTKLFKAETIEKMAEEFEMLLDSIVKNSLTPIKQLFSKGDELFIEKLEQWNNTSFVYDKDVNLTKIIDKKATELHDKVAIFFLQEKITYSEVMKLSNQFANYLLANDVKLGDIVGLGAERSIEMVISMLGILKAGATYLPLDPNFPQDRIEYMLADSNAKAIVVSKSHQNKFKTNANELVIEDIWAKILLSSDEDPGIHTKGTDLAYILYTSGSTGKPKGVKIMHQSLVNLLISLHHTLGIKESDKLLAITTISFDIAALELFLPLVGGAAFFLCDTESAKDGRVLLELLETENITLMQATPSTWRMMIDSGWDKQYKELKIVSGGESLNKDLANRLLDLTGELWNIYAPTETTIYSIAKKIDKHDKLIAIGRPIYNTQVYILDSNGDLLPPGSVGEICIGGDGVSSGYLNLPELTNKVFIESPINKSPYRKIYKTGDLGMFTDDGEIVCFGRIDEQVKIRGHRIELGEIESILNELSEIRQSVVIAYDDSTEDKRLVAYVVLNVANDGFQDDNERKKILNTNKEKWKLALRNKLPKYMVPNDFVILEAFPLTPNRKIDKKALPAPNEGSRSENVRRESAHVYDNKHEKIISEIWSSVLNIDSIGPKDNFFELGGHSLLAIKIMVAIEKATGKRLPLSILFENSTIEKLAKELEEDQFDNWKSLVPIKEIGHKPPLYVIHGQGMHILSFYTLSNAMSKEQPLYGLQPKGLNPEVAPAESIEEIAKGYVDEIIQHNPAGPYSIAGYSSGGIVALEMSKQLMDRGKKVSIVALIDTFYDGDSYITLFKKGKIKEIFNHACKYIGWGFLYFFRYPNAYIQHNIDFSLGTLYNNYKKINPIKEVLSNPMYILDRLQKAHKKALKKYQLKDYNAKVVLFRANDKEYVYIPNLDSNGFAPYIKGEFTFVDVPLEHLQFFNPNYIEVFAEKLQEELDSCQGSGNADIILKVH